MDSYMSSPSSPLTSLGSRSPSPPDYPSPPSSSSQSERDPQSSTPDASLNDTTRDGPPPAKKRKIAEPKERKTEYLNLEALDGGSDQSDPHHQQLKELVNALRKKRKIVVIAGAGISVSAGSMLRPIPTR